MQNSKYNFFPLFSRNLFIFFAVSLILAGCAKKKSVFQENQNQKIKVVATIFPLYDWAKNIAVQSEHIETELLIKNGVDLHSFQPSTSDILKILSADILIYAGGESDFWIEDALKNSINKNMIQINLMEELSDFLKEEEFVEGMTEESDFKNQNHKSNYTLELANHTHDEVEYDEHFWLSVKNAKESVKKIAEILEKKAGSEAGLIEANKKNYLEELDKINLDENSEIFPKTIIVCDRFPFRYMVDELGIKYFAAFAGCSAETEASFETIAFLSDKVKSLGAKKVFVTESSDKKIAQTVIKNAGFEKKCEIATLNSMQAVTLSQADSGINYIDIMKENYQKLSEQR